MHPCYTVRPVRPPPLGIARRFWQNVMPRAVSTHLASRVLFPVWLASSVVVPVGCFPQPSNASAEVQALPEYKDVDVKLFDDSCEPFAVGLSLDRPSSRGNALFRDRAQHATNIARMRVDTVTSGGGLTRSVIRLGLKREGKPLLGKDNYENLELEVATGAPAFSLFKQAGDRIRGRAIVVMWKTFRVNDEPVIHFYVAPDDEETAAAVKDAVALQELTGGK